MMKFSESLFNSSFYIQTVGPHPIFSQLLIDCLPSVRWPPVHIFPPATYPPSVGPRLALTKSVGGSPTPARKAMCKGSGSKCDSGLVAHASHLFPMHASSPCTVARRQVAR
jgi:hypothetical protein